ncbi:Ubiquinone/menaquinone biosynthesis C-methylase UbiE [Desulfoluna spongiiphila]|uniref:Ubiquinone/menaquinone biosynthesis C-methylase UbiE n=2 Tax=Desulfoluna spongiiphila TaxID=419481 RepID=A0A1G5I5X3_9BACT|nr:Ubiquinone/menaquinone biosynthesis C-methylase UbiE [Desulfoluna spongiiphila]VVS92704.1 s-adenosyl-l-methionine-dependent methyltransferase [Desulfoluna spongiiphila]
MGHVFNFQEAGQYAQWLEMDRHRDAAERQSQLMVKLIKPAYGDRLLDIGCGTGVTLACLDQIKPGLDLTGLDASTYMLDIAGEKLNNRADLFKGTAEALPFEDNAFNFAVVNLTLEFVESPEKVIAEAARVAKDRLYIGFFNRLSLGAVPSLGKGLHGNAVFSKARFLSTWEIRQIIRGLLGKVPLTSRTITYHPPTGGRLLGRLFHRLPYGAYTGLSVSLVPRFTTRPLALFADKPRPQSMSIGEQYFKPDLR